MSGQTFILGKDRGSLLRLIARLKNGLIVNIREPRRSNDQNAKLWAMLSDISRAKPDGRHWTSETWKAAFMHSLGHELQFCEGLDGSGPFPVGFRSSRLTVGQMADLITCAQEYGDRHGVEWTDKGEA